MPYSFEAPVIYIQRFYTGWISNRNQLVTPIRAFGRRIIELYDALLAGNDLEVSQRLTLIRRYGYLQYSTATLAANAMNFFSWRSASLGLFPIIDTLNDIEFVGSAASSPTTIYSKAAGQTGVQSRFLGIGNFLYIGNPQFNIKWDGGQAQGKTNWGISMGSGSSSSATNTATQGSTASGGTGPFWTNAGAVTGSSSFAIVSPGIRGTSNFLLAETFGFSVSGSVVNGIAVSFTANSSSPSVNVQMLKNGSAIGTAKTIGATSGTQSVTLGSASDLWGTTFTANDVDQTTFGVQFQALGGAQVGGTAQIQNVQITVYFSNAPTASTTGAGAFAASNGWSYVFCYYNSNTGHVSNASPISNNTGPFNSKASVQFAVTASTDPQVTGIRVFRTTDSGGGSVFYELPNSPFANSTGNITDTALDSALIVSAQAPIYLQNSPPPGGLTNMEWWSGRMWGSVGNLLYASNGPETILGNPNECWPPGNVYVLPTNISRLVATPSGMLVICQDDNYIVRGTDIVNYTVNEFVRDVGCRSYNCVDTDGSNIYAFTSDRQLLQLSANGITDVGQPIADQLANVDPTQAYLKLHRAGQDNMMFLQDPANNLIYSYNVNQQCWNLPQMLQKTAQSCGSIEVSPGVWKFLVGFGTTVGQRDFNTFSDLGSTYQPNAAIGSIGLADPFSLAKTEGIVLDLSNAGSVPTLKVLANELGCTMTNAVGSQITGAFQTLNTSQYPEPWPPALAPPSTSYRSLIWYWSVCKLSQFVKFIQFQVSFPSEAAANEILGFATSGKNFQDVAQPGQLPQLQGR